MRSDNTSELIGGWTEEHDQVPYGFPYNLMERMLKVARSLNASLCVFTPDAVGGSGAEFSDSNRAINVFGSSLGDVRRKSFRNFKDWMSS